MKVNVVNNDPTSALAIYVVKEITKLVLNKNQKPKSPVERWCDYTLGKILKPRQ